MDTFVPKKNNFTADLKSLKEGDSQNVFAFSLFYSTLAPLRKIISVNGRSFNAMNTCVPILCLFTADFKSLNEDDIQNVFAFSSPT